MRTRAALAVTALLMVAAACGGDDAGMTVSGAWSRASATVANPGVVYMDLTSADGDTLIGVSVDPAIAGAAQIHETSMTGMSGDDMSGHDMGDGSGDDMSGMDMGMQMMPISELALAAGTTVSFEPGGYHVMLLDLVEALEVGDTFQLTLEFETAGQVVVDVEVREDAP